MNVADIRAHFIHELESENFVVSRDGSKTIELMGASFLADAPAIFGTPNQEYIAAEIKWYDSRSLNVNDIYRGDKPAPAAWRMTANEHGEINSNYGWMIYSQHNFDQYTECRRELLTNPNSRRAVMIYTRPDIQKTYYKGGMNDFICTNAVSYAIRDGHLNAVVQMRSNDVIFGYRNDYAWQEEVLNRLAFDLKVIPGDIVWQVQNLHVYERHFHLVK